ncbi:MAG: hypothetical protein ABW185_10120, partial [Sedimenticola sp.]
MKGEPGLKLKRDIKAAVEHTASSDVNPWLKHKEDGAEETVAKKAALKKAAAKKAAPKKAAPKKAAPKKAAPKKA